MPIQPRLDDFRFKVCTRGFMIDAGGEYGLMGQIYAFDHIEDVAAWIVETYRDAHAKQKPTPEENFIAAKVGKLA